MRRIITVFSLCLIAIIGPPAAAASSEVAAPVRIPINRTGSPQVDVLFRNSQDGSLVPIPMVLLTCRWSYVTRNMLVNYQREWNNGILNYTFQNCSRILSRPEWLLTYEPSACLGIGPDSRIVQDFGAVGKIWSNFSATDSLVLGGSYDTDFAPFCDQESILTLPARIHSVSVTVQLQGQSNNDGSATTSQLQILSSLALSIGNFNRVEVILGLPESEIEHIAAPIVSAGAVYEATIEDGEYDGSRRFSNCTSSIFDQLPVVIFNLTRYVDVDRQISLGHFAIHPSEYIDFLNDEPRTCFLKIETLHPPHFGTIAMLNVLAIPDMNLWITPDNVTICDAL
jgi:hypothetical protein